MISTKKGYSDHVSLVVMECVIIKEIVDNYRKIDKVKRFLVFVIHKMRYQKTKASSILI